MQYKHNITLNDEELGVLITALFSHKLVTDQEVVDKIIEKINKNLNELLYL